jgi:hypothetical protein
MKAVNHAYGKTERQGLAELAESYLLTGRIEGEANLPDVVSWSHFGSLEPVTGDHDISKSQV